MVKKENNLHKRLFVAIDIPEHIKKYLYETEDRLFSKDKGIRKIPCPNIHVTLKFLGNVNLNKIEKIKNAIKETTDNFCCFDYKIAGSLGAFSSFRSARIIFAEIKSGSDKIIEIYDKLEDNFSKIKIRKEKRKFIPHITIARIKRSKNIENLVKNIKLDLADTIKCCKLTLFESRLKPSGAEYIIIEEFSLK